MGLLRTTERVGCRLVIDRDALRLDSHVVGFNLQFGQRLCDSVRSRAGMGQRVTQGRRGVDRRKDLTPRRFDVCFETFDLPVRRFVSF